MMNCRRTAALRHAMALGVLLGAMACAPGSATAQAPEKASTPTGATHTYRLTFTVTSSSAGKRSSVQHYAMTILPGGVTVELKQGTKNPLITGGYSHEGAPGTEYQFTYIDVGTNLDAKLTETDGGLELSTKIEESSIADAGNLQAMKDPVVQQAVLKNSTLVKPGVPVMIGSLDVPGTAQHLDIEVVLERVS